MQSVFVAALVISVQRRWLWISITGALAEIIAGLVFGARLEMILAVSVVSALEALGCAYLLVRTLTSADMARVDNILRYLAIVALASTLGGLAASTLRTLIVGGDFSDNAFVWASRDFTGLAALTPCFIVLASRRSELPGLLGLRAWPLVLLAGLEAVIFLTPVFPLTFMVVAGLLLVTWRLRIAGAAVGVLMTAAIAIAGTLLGQGPFAVIPGTVSDHILILQLFLTVCFHVTVPVAGQVANARQLAEALQVSEARYRLLAENVNDLVTCYKDEIVTFASGAVEPWLGFPASEMVGRRIQEVMHPDDVAPSLEVYRRHRAAGPPGEPFRLEFRLRRKDGDYVWVEANPRGIWNAEGQLVEWQDLQRDISQRISLEAELRAARAEAEATTRRKADFLADMAHELRGPLHGILALTRDRRIQADRPTPRSTIEAVRKAIRSLLLVVEDTLDYARLEADQVTFRSDAVAVDAFLRETMDLVHPQARAKRLEVGLTDLTPPGLVVSTDANRLRQVVLNLLGNAVKFTGSGAVTLQAEYDEAASELFIEVRDTGPGIGPDQLEHLFERFKRGRSSPGAPAGVGLGLAIAMEIVEGLGGEIGVESEPGCGSRFFFRIPAVEVVRSGETSSAGVDANRLQMLVASADHTAAAIIADAMGARAEVRVATDLTAARLVLDAAPVDLLFVDLGLAEPPTAADIRNLRKARGPNVGVPVLAIAETAGTDASADVASLGLQGLVTRACTRTEIISAVVSALAPAGRTPPPSTRARAA